MSRGRRRPGDTVALLRHVAAADDHVDAFVDADGRRLSFGEWDRAADGIAHACYFLAPSLERLNLSADAVFLQTQVAHVLDTPTDHARAELMMAKQIAQKSELAER